MPASDWLYIVHVTQILTSVWPKWCLSQRGHFYILLGADGWGQQNGRKGQDRWEGTEQEGGADREGWAKWVVGEGGAERVGKGRRGGIHREGGAERQG